MVREALASRPSTDVGGRASCVCFFRDGVVRRRGAQRWQLGRCEELLALHYRCRDSEGYAAAEAREEQEQSFRHRCSYRWSC